MRRGFVRVILLAAGLALLAACGGGGGGGADPASLVVNGSFEDPDVPSGFSVVPASEGNLRGWTFVNGNPIAIVDNLAVSGGEAWQAYQGDQFVQLDIGGNGGIFQAVATVPGARYTVSFAYKPRPDSDFDTCAVLFYLNDAFMDSIPFPNARFRAWIPYFYSFTATGTATNVMFVAAGNDDGSGGFIDDVRVVASED